jgi:hypothetical protein
METDLRQSRISDRVRPLGLRFAVGFLGRVRVSEANFFERAARAQRSFLTERKFPDNASLTRRSHL